jgi:hypothetical protein
MKRKMKTRKNRKAYTTKKTSKDFDEGHHRYLKGPYGKMVRVTEIKKRWGKDSDKKFEGRK